jgi:hypothetical protein
LDRIGLHSILRDAPFIGRWTPSALLPPNQVPGSYSGPVPKFDQTAKQFIISLVKSRKATTTGQINVAWKKAGRGGKADNTLSLMVKAGTLKRKNLLDERGSRYALA